MFKAFKSNARRIYEINIPSRLDKSGWTGANVGSPRTRSKKVDFSDLQLQDLKNELTIISYMPLFLPQNV